MLKRKRVSLRLARFMGRQIPLDLCWNSGEHNSLDHVHDLQAQDDMGGGEEFELVKKLMVTKGRWCRQCVIGYRITTDASRAFYEVVRLNHNEFAGNLPPEIILMIYRHLLKKPLLFKECSEVRAIEKILH